MVSVASEFPVYAASSVSKLLPQVVMVMIPFDGAVHRYQTDAPPVEKWAGSPTSTVAPTLDPVTVGEAPVSSRAESKASLLPKASAALGVAVGVRDAGHIGLESLVSLLPESLRLKVEVLIHALVALFGAIMTHSGWIWTRLKWNELDPMLGMPEGLDYFSLVVAGVLIVLFSIEHIIALLRGEDVEPAWY